MKTLSNFLALLCIAVVGSVSASTDPSKESKADEFGWTFAYDDADRVTKITDPAGRDTRFDYNFFDPKEKQYLREHVKIAADGSRVVHEFDKDGRLTRMKDSAGEVSYGYDERGWLKRVERQGELAITYDRDPQGRITRMQVGDFKLAYRYDFLGRLSSINTPAGPIEYAYHAGQGVVERKYPNGIRTFSHYEPNGELREITHGYFANPTDTSYQVLAKYNYQYRPDGLIAAMTEQSGRGQFIQLYDYDQVGRLVKADGPDGQTFSYEYDLLGNRLKVTAPNTPPKLSEFDWAGRMTRLDGAPATHDAAGNLTSVTVGGEAMNYRYTPDNQLAEASGKVNYRYDGEGRLLERRAGGAETRFIPDPLSSNWKPLAMETKGGGRSYFIWEGDTPLMQIKNGKPEYFLHDHQGSVRIVADEHGQLAQRLDYDPFGTPMNAGTAKEFAPRFAGRFFDPEAKVYLDKDRAYAPETGRWLQAKPERSLPTGEQKDLSLFAFHGNNPVNTVANAGQGFDEAATRMPTSAFLAGIQADLHRSVADAVDDTRLRTRAQAGERAYEQAKASHEIQALDRPGVYDENKMTLFVRAANPKSLVPHTGIHFGEELKLGELRLDGVELQPTKVQGREGMTISVPMLLKEQESRGSIQLKPLETTAIKVLYEGKEMPIRDLPNAKKAEIQAHLKRLSLEEMGKTRGQYEFAGKGLSNQCVDMTLDLLDRAVKASGIQFPKDTSHSRFPDIPIELNYRNRFTVRVGGLAAANPTVYGGLANALPRVRNGEPGFLASDLREQSIGLLKQAAQDELERLENLPGKWGQRFAGVHGVVGLGELSMEILDSVQSILEHRGDPASDWRVASIGFSAYSFFGGVYEWGVLLPEAADGLGTVGALAHTLGEATRSRILQNRAESLSHFGGAVLDRPARIKEDYDRYHGSFSALSDRYSTEGGWVLRHSNSGWLERNSHSRAWALSHVNDLRTMEGARISGTFWAEETRDEYGKSLFNLYEPTSSTIRRHRHESYTISRGGARQETPRVATGNSPMTSSSPTIPIEKSKPPFQRKLKRPDDYPSLFPPDGSGGGGGGALVPSPVGGVYLGGAGQLLQRLGALEGIGQDANGNLILLGKSGGEIKLPPLRLDDVVTVFRSVYLNGEGPTVTIDPNPDNPTGSAMLVRHSEATDGTYVGWVLYQADRLMKGYSLGKDNITLADLHSAVPGYAAVLDRVYFGGEWEGEHWERFWIVPAEARRFAATTSELTLFDVPLKVRTQPMKWEGKALVDDPQRAPSPGATAFTDWFTRHYDGIGKERYLIPPPESGITEPVPVFSELRRIALLTAMAEALRDQGVPLPFWMRDYKVRPVPFDKTTPLLQLTRRDQGREVRISGGVNLSPPQADVKTFTQSTELAQLPEAEQAAARQTLKRADALAAPLRQALAKAPPLQTQSFTYQGVTQPALALPGADTLALAPAQLDEADLTVPMAGGGAIQLLRRYHSFFNPTGPWGEGWALDLPRLETAKLPVESDAQGHVTYRLVYEVVTPLNSVSARFSKMAEVPELKGAKLIVPDRSGEFLALADDEPLDFVVSVKKAIDGKKPMRIIRKDGGVWHFSLAGDLIATEHAGSRTVYERDAKGRVTRIVGLQGKWLAASIQLTYDQAGRLQSATGQRETGGSANDKATVHYEYDASGKLAVLFSDAGRIGYQYQGSRVVAVTYKGPDKDDAEQTVRRFEYNALGQLLAEQDASGAKTAYRLAADATGSTLTATRAGTDAKPDSIQYDAAFRPLQARYADGSTASWQYGKDGTAMILADADGSTIRLAESADQRRRTLELNPQHKLVNDYDTAGRLISLTDNDHPLLRQEWEADGRLRLAANDATAIYPNYDESGLLSRVILAPPGALGKTGAPWQATRLDPLGRPLEISDYSGLQVRLGYEKTGELQAMLIQRGGKNYGFQFKRDPAGRIEAVDSSWDQQHFGYDAQGWLNRAEVVRGNARSVAEWKAGRLVKVSQFDGGETRLSYSDSDPERIRQITAPNGLVLDYQHDPSGRLQEVAIGSTTVSLAYDESGRVKRWVYHAGGKPTSGQ